ncbi:hypothetical protein PG996_010927 [Apiospora saccharicola]|uniref:Uncharacterized protein n=1 Tax=Apiospora saccharicola TaxID=335842 RepID=A0ABR1UGK9_9PEZI
MPSSHRPRDKGSAKYPHGILRPAVAEMETPQKPLQGSYPVPGQHLVQILAKSAPITKSHARYPVPTL